MTGYKFYEDSLKRKVLDDIQSGNISKEEARRKYKIRGHSTILKWFRNLEHPENLSRIMTKEYEKVDKEALIKRIKELERQLEDEKLRAEGYSKMIDIAEEQLKITIRKKSTTKQSKR
jgi:transposase